MRLAWLLLVISISVFASATELSLAEPLEPLECRPAAWATEGVETFSDEAADEDAAMLETVALYPNYPNPFNPETEIGFDLTQTTLVSVSVYDILGQHVATLASGILAAGHHSVYFDGSDLPAGAYFCRLIAAGITQTQKMVLLKYMLETGDSRGLCRGCPDRSANAIPAGTLASLAHCCPKPFPVSLLK
jgi:hypothetical protein